jgi:Tol biopolymer transport system component
MVVGARGRWGWSPIADCGVHIDANGELLITAVDPSTSTEEGLAVGAGIPLVRPTVESFSFSPDGRALGLVIVDGRRREIWVADLKRNKMAAVTRFPSSTCCVTLGGWTPDGAELLFWASPGTSVSADGWLLQSVDPETRRISSFTAMRVRPALLERCAGDLLGIVGGDRFDVGPMRLAELQPGSAPRYLTPRTESHFSFSCTANGALIATARGEVRDGSDPVGSTSRTEVTIVGVDGSEVITLTPAGMSDAAPEWGPPGTGLTFVRLSDGGAMVLFAAEGRTPTALGVSVSIPRLDSAWHQVLDWSVTPPDGLPTRS